MAGRYSLPGSGLMQVAAGSLALVLANACTAIPDVTPLPSRGATGSPIASAEGPTPHPTPDLAHRPLVWFHPLPPMQTFPGIRTFTGSDDFMELFAPGAPWETAASQIQVFHLYGEWLGRDATNEQVRTVVSDLNRRGMGISLSGGALPPSTECTGEIEGFAGIVEGIRISRRVKEAGGTALFFAFDHAYDAATASTTPPECRRSPEVAAQQAWEFTTAIRNVFPDIIVGDDITAGLDVGEIARWVEAYRSVAGEDLGFIHLDVDFGIAGWEHKAFEIETYLRSRGIAFGLFYLGQGNSPSDEAWLTEAGERVKTYELGVGGQPDHILFASWNDHPDHVLPETEPYTFTNFVRRYFEDRASLGVRTTGPGANLAYRKEVTASAAATGLSAERAVDGLFDTWWGAGAPAPQWIEVDLGAPSAIAKIRLGISQDPAGPTTHRVWGSGPADANPRLLYEFDGLTAGDQVLEYAPPDPWQAIQFVRVETLSSPSWVSWREIEVLAPQ